MVSAVALAAALGSCTFEEELLNSDRITEEFGSYGLELIAQDAGVRRASLYSVENGVRICRTYAVTRFAESNLAELAAAHAAIVDGASIGATFKSLGWTITKQTDYIGELELRDTQHAIAKLMALDKPAMLAMHVYRLMLAKDATTVHYATIIETHHPDYLTLSELSGIYEWEPVARQSAENLTAIAELVLGTSH